LPTKKNRLSWSLDREIRRGLVALIGHRSDEADEEGEGAELNDKGSNGFRDLLGLMINAGGGKKAPAIPVADMLEECKTFFFAGKQTTTNLLTWATVLLAMHPDWQERARREVLAVCGADELPSKDHLPRLKMVHQLLQHSSPLHIFSLPNPNHQTGHLQSLSRGHFRNSATTKKSHFVCSSLSPVVSPCRWA
jgi:PHYB activation tagged suppressor 1